MDEWKEQTKEYAIYCKEDKKEAWINDINALDIANFSELPYTTCEIRESIYEDRKKSFIKTAEIMKALDEGESWEQIAVRLMEGQKYYQYPIGEIGHMMLVYSKYGVEFVKTIIGNAIGLMGALQEEFNAELEKENKHGLGK